MKNITDDELNKQYNTKVIIKELAENTGSIRRHSNTYQFTEEELINFVKQVVTHFGGKQI